MKTSIIDYTTPVYRSLMEPDLIMGVGAEILLGIIVVTVILATLVSIWCISIGVFALVFCNIISKKDPYLLKILFSNLLQSDFYKL